MRNSVLLAAKLLVVALPAASAASAAPIHRPSARPQLVRSALSLRGGAAVGGSPSPGGGGAQMVPPHASTAKDVLEQAGVVADAGLSDARAAELLKKFGRNELEADAGTPLWALFLAQFDDRLVQILLAVAALSYGLALLEGKPDDWVESAVILLILLLNAVVGTWQEASAAGALSALQSLQPETARCLRGGTWINELSAAELVPGDVIELRVGDSVPADARVVQMLSTARREQFGARFVGAQFGAQFSDAAPPPPRRVSRPTRARSPASRPPCRSNSHRWRPTRASSRRRAWCSRARWSRVGARSRW